MAFTTEQEQQILDLLARLSEPKTTQELFNENPSAGNDPTVQAVFPASNGVIDVGMTIEQISQAVSFNLGLIDNPGQTSFFAMTVIDNSLNAVISPLVNVNYLFWKITKDDDTIPLITDSGWNTGTINPSYDISEGLPADPDHWVEHAYRLWVHDQTTVTQVLPIIPDPSSDVQALYLSANDTLGPLWGATTLTIAQGTNPGELDITLTEPVDNESGLTGDYVIKNADDDTVVGFITAPTLTTTIAGLNTGQLYSFYPTTTDNAGNPSGDPELHSVSATPTASAGGVISLEASPAVAEDSGPFLITARITGRTASGATSFDLSTVDETALAGTNYTAISGGTYTFPDGDNSDLSIPVTLITPGGGSVNNTMFTASVDPGSATNGATIDTDLDKQAILCKINGTGTVTPDHYTQDLTPEFESRLDATGYTANNAGTGTAWIQDTFATKTVMKQFSVVAGGYTGDPDWVTNAPSLDFDIDMDAGEYDLYWKAGVTTGQSDRNSIKAFIDGTDGFSPVGTTDSFNDDGTLTWHKYPATVTVSAGRHIIRMAQREPRAPNVQQIFLAKTGTGYTVPSGTTDLTPDSLVGGAATDHPDNPANPTYPNQIGLVTPTTVTPADASTTAVPGVNPQWTFTGMTELIVNQTQGMTRNGMPISGLWESNGTNIATFKPSLSLDYDAVNDYVLKLSGQIRDGGILKDIDTTFSVSFKIRNPANTDIMLSVDFSNHATQTVARGLEYTPTLVRQDFPQILGYPQRTHIIVGADIERGSGVTREQAAWLGVSPDGDLSKGNVLESSHPADKTGYSLHWHGDFYDLTDIPHIPYVGGPEEAYLYWEEYVDANWEFTASKKYFGFTTGTHLEGSHQFQQGSIPRGDVAFSCRVISFDIPEAGDGGFNRGDGAVGLYVYDGRRVAKTAFSDIVDPTAANNQRAYLQSRATWIGFQLRLKMNTSVKITGVTNQGSTTLITTSAPHNLSAGDKCVIFDINESMPDGLTAFTDFNGPWASSPYSSADQNPAFPENRTVLTAPTTTTFTISGGVTYTPAGTEYVNAFDGILELRVKDSVKGYSNKLIVQDTARLIRWTEFVRVDDLSISNHYGGNVADAWNAPKQRQSKYYSIIEVSKSSIM